MNWSQCGKTTRTILPSWTNAMPAITKGDCVLFQFGINDSDPGKFVDEKEFMERLSAYVDFVRGKGATPILCSPVSALGYGKDAPADAKFVQEMSRRVYGGYAKALAAEKSVAFVDMTALTENYILKVGKDEALTLYPGDSKMWGRYWFDDTHPTKKAAAIYARLFVGDVRSRRLGIAAISEHDPVDETAHWQAVIDKGGRVVIPRGIHDVGELRLRSGVELHLEEGAELRGLPDLSLYSKLEKPYSEGKWGAVLLGVGITNVAITGRGVVNGRGGLFDHSGHKPRGIVFVDSSRISLSDFTFRDSANWGIAFKCCDGVDIRRITIDNHANDCNDGIDVEAKNVVIEGCDIDAGDDAICIKSNDPDFTVENILVTNCTVRSQCNGLKLGTASHGTMRSIRFVDCRTDRPRRNYRYRTDSWDPGKEAYYWTIDEENPLGIGSGALCVECVDGGRVEDVVFENVVANGFSVPIFVRAGRRLRRGNGIRRGTEEVMRNILFRHVRGEAQRCNPSSVSGVAGFHPENVRFEDVRIVCRACRADDRRLLAEPGFMYDGFYPDAEMWRMMKLPAYGLYVDRADVKLADTVFALRKGEREDRPGVYFSTAESAAKRGSLSALAKPLVVTDAELADHRRLVKMLREGGWDKVVLAVAVKEKETYGDYSGRIGELADLVREHAPAATVTVRRVWKDESFDRLAATNYGFILE